MFVKFSGANRKGVPQLYVDRRIEYFHNYWQVAQPKDSDLFFDEVRIESHRSLLTKIEHQLRYNFRHCAPRFAYLFTNHELFSPNNIIIKKTPILNLRNTIINGFAVGNPNNQSANQTRILKEVGQLKQKILGRPDYSVKLANHLVKVLSTNQPLNDQVKADIRFLATSFIVELYHHGYDLKYIAALPNVLLFGKHIHYEYPYEKTKEDFGYDDEQYNSYVEQENQNRSVDKVLRGFVNVVRRPLKDFYFVFKVDNIFLIDPHPIVVGEVEFYNPQLQSRIEFFGKDIDWKTQYLQTESFYAPREGEETDNAKLSNCNAVVPAKYRDRLSIASPDALLQAYHTVVKAVEILSDLQNRHGGTREGKGRVDIHKHFAMYPNNRMGDHNFNLFHEMALRIDFTDARRSRFERERDFQEELTNLNKIDLKTEMGQKLMHVFSVNSKLANKPESFNFKELWIAWESIMGPGTKTMIEFAQAVFRFRYKKDYLIMAKLFLKINLERHYGEERPGVWSLSDKDLKGLGLDTQPNEVVDTLRFKRQYHQLDSMIPLEMVKDTTARVHELATAPNAFLAKLDKWVENTVEEFYVERNMEVHRNLENGLTKFKLKEHVLYMSRWLVFMMANYSDKRNIEKIDLTLSKVKTAAAKVRI